MIFAEFTEVTAAKDINMGASVTIVFDQSMICNIFFFTSTHMSCLHLTFMFMAFGRHPYTARLTEVHGRLYK